MTDSRSQILGGIAKSLGRISGDAQRAAARERIAAHARNLIPARAQLDPADQVRLFEQMALEVSATVARVPDLDAVPDAVAGYLAGHNLPAELRAAPDPALDAIPWDRRPTLTVSTGRARDADAVSLTGAFAGIAETGTLMLVSGAERPTTLNFLPDTHIVVLKAEQIVGGYEDAWDRLRAQAGSFEGGMPRTVNMVTGPSRTGDIEQTIQLGAHGPRRLHIVLVEG
ncbi:lactate utilization protein [Azospirillum sp. TSO22-1]|uniref:LutC/YkgG family protein n=1 Tax=Azospirillum sp. TSO22-1 TaxID=716789 RepID=UPI000D61F437|nr:lactate utilization protein [Azospirillum sp. TSO22-1]PWC41350.1 L-lactate dehydrogenase [Azospirillum sp. TSO22-1]